MYFGSGLQVDQQSRRVGSDTLYYQVAGHGRPVILLHGLSGSGRWWGKNITSLARHLRVYAIDMVGFGRARGQDFTLRHASRVLLDFMDAMGLERTSIVGHSMGGFITLDLAARYPNRAERIALVDALALPLGRSHTRNVLGLVQSLRYMPTSFLPVLLADAMRAGPRTLLKATLQVLEADIRSDLTRVSVPTLIVWGEYDTILPLDQGKELHQYLPKAQFAVIEGAGHNPMWDRPEPFNRVLVDFLLDKQQIKH